MTTYDKILKYYTKGIYKEKHLKVFLSKGIITQEQYDTIIGTTEAETPAETETAAE